MAQEIKNASLFGRLGTGIGKGLAEQAPKEIERHRLATGLRELGEKKDLSPFQQFAELSSIPGVTPQMIESGSKLLKQQGINSALANKAGQSSQPVQNPFPQAPAQNKSGNAPSITTRSPIEATLNPTIPKNLQQLQVRSGELITEDPALYGQDPEKAMQAAILEDEQLQKQNAALQTQRVNQQGVQNQVKNQLNEQKKTLGAELPGNVYSLVEDKAINAVLAKNEGGESLTEQEAIKKYGSELDSISRQYKAAETIGGPVLISKKPGDNRAAINSLQNQFKERDDLENFAHLLTAKNGLSPSKAFYMAKPVRDVKDLNNAIQKLPSITPQPNLSQTLTSNKAQQEAKENVVPKTLEVAKKLAPLLRQNKNASPLAVATELNALGYDAKAWMDYVDKNRKEIGLTEEQARELNYPRDFFDTLGDLWMFGFSGLDKLVEQ